MKIVVLADIHSQLEPLERMHTALSAADVVLLAGDITNFGNTKHVQAVFDTLGQHARTILAVPGNCDPPMVDAWLTQNGRNLHGRAVGVDGWWFVGAGGTLPELGRLPNEAGDAYSPTPSTAAWPSVKTPHGWSWYPTNPHGTPDWTPLPLTDTPVTGLSVRLSTAPARVWPSTATSTILSEQTKSAPRPCSTPAPPKTATTPRST